MAIPIPIGHTGAIRRFPAATVGLIIINILVFLFTTKIIEKTQLNYARKTEDLIVYESQLMETKDFQRFKRYADFVQIGDINSALKEVQEFRNEIKSGRVVEFSSKEFRRWQVLYAAYQTAMDGAFLQRFGFVPAKFNILGLFTSMYLHGGWLHLIGNMLFLWVMGGAVEDKWGIPVFLVFYHIGGVFASLTQYVANREAIVPMIGASGAIAAAMGAFLIRHYKTRIKIAYLLFMYVGRFELPAWLVLPIWLGDQYFNAVTYKDMTGVAVWAHIGGFLFGVLFAVLIVLTNIEKKYLTPEKKILEEDRVWKKEETAERETLDRNIEIGRELIARGKYSDALISFNAALLANPQNMELLKLLYFTYVKVGNMEEAVNVAGKILDILIMNKRNADALQVFREVKKVYPASVFSVRTQYNLARALQASGVFPEAARAYYEFAVAYPENQISPKALFISAEILLQNLNDKRNAYKILIYLNQRYPNHLNYQKALEHINDITKSLSPPQG